MAPPQQTLEPEKKRTLHGYFFPHLVTHLSHFHPIVKRLFQGNLKTTPLVGGMAYLVLNLWWRQMVKAINLQFCRKPHQRTPPTKNNVSERRSCHTNKDEGVVEEGNNKTCSKFRGLVCKQHLSKTKERWLVLPYNKPKIEQFHSI